MNTMAFSSKGGGGETTLCEHLGVALPGSVALLDTDPQGSLAADEYGNGVVGAWNRKGMGRTLKPGP